MKDGLNDGGKATGAKITVQAAQGETDLTGQASILTNVSNGDATCYAVAPISATNLIAPLTAISKAGKAIVNIDSQIDPQAATAAGLKIATFIASDSEKAGELAGTEMVKLLGGKGTVALIGGLAGNANSNARLTGFKKTAGAGGLTIAQEVNADWDAQKALNAATAILTAKPDLGGFYAANDGMAIGVAKAVTNASRSVKVIGTDGNADAIAAIQKGTMSATVSQYPYVEGLMGLEACQVLAQGGQLPANVDAPLALVTPDNAARAVSAAPKPFDPYTDPIKALLK